MLNKQPEPFKRLIKILNITAVILFLVMFAVMYKFIIIDHIWG